MSIPDYSILFSCHRCGKSGSIYLVRVVGPQIIVKQRCPDHGGRAFKFPLMRKDVVTKLFHDGFFRCYKCGQKAPMDSKKTSRRWTLLKLNCPTHGNNLPFQKLWGTLYNEVISKEGEGPGYRAPEPVLPEPVEKQPEPTPDKKFCPNCGTPLEGIEAFCGSCGNEID